MILATSMLYYFNDDYKDCEIIRSNEKDDIAKADLVIGCGKRLNHK